MYTFAAKVWDSSWQFYVAPCETLRFAFFLHHSSACASPNAQHSTIQYTRGRHVRATPAAWPRTHRTPLHHCHAGCRTPACAPTQVYTARAVWTCGHGSSSRVAPSPAAHTRVSAVRGYLVVQSGRACPMCTTPAGFRRRRVSIQIATAVEGVRWNVRTRIDSDTIGKARAGRVAAAPCRLIISECCRVRQLGVMVRGLPPPSCITTPHPHPPRPSHTVREVNARRKGGAGRTCDVLKYLSGPWLPTEHAHRTSPGGITPLCCDARHCTAAATFPTGLAAGAPAPGSTHVAWEESGKWTRHLAGHLVPPSCVKRFTLITDVAGRNEQAKAGDREDEPTLRRGVWVAIIHGPQSGR